MYEQIRRDRRNDPQVSIRTLAERYRVHRREVRRALGNAVPPSRKALPPRAATVIDPVKPVIDAMLRGDLSAPRKQRHTTQRIYTRLAREHGFSAASYSTVLNYVNERRREIAEEERERRMHLDGFVPQVHAPRRGGRGRLRRGVGTPGRGGGAVRAVHPAAQFQRQGRPSTEFSRVRARRRSWRGISRRSPRSGGSRPGISGTTI
jgi:hypothetical protein